MVKRSIRIEDSSRVAVIGGGPAGSLFVLFLLRFAKERHISPEVTIYEQRRLDERGPKGCKDCAGIHPFRLRKLFALFVIFISIYMLVK